MQYFIESDFMWENSTEAEVTNPRGHASNHCNILNQNEEFLSMLSSRYRMGGIHNINIDEPNQYFSRHVPLYFRQLHLDE